MGLTPAASCRIREVNHVTSAEGERDHEPLPGHKENRAATSTTRRAGDDFIDSPRHVMKLGHCKMGPRVVGASKKKRTATPK